MAENISQFTWQYYWRNVEKVERSRKSEKERERDKNCIYFFFRSDFEVKGAKFPSTRWKERVYLITFRVCSRNIPRILLVNFHSPQGCTRNAINLGIPREWQRGELFTQQEVAHVGVGITLTDFFSFLFLHPPPPPSPPTIP